jgi:hypothetical protein
MLPCVALHARRQGNIAYSLLAAFNFPVLNYSNKIEVHPYKMRILIQS